MKLGKLLLAGLALCVFLAGCQKPEILTPPGNDQLYYPSGDMQQITESEEPFIGFSETEAKSAEDMTQIKPEELQNYTSKYSQYNSYIYFEHLNDAEKLLYHAYEYALDEAQSCFWIEDQLLEGMERTAAQVLEFLSLDSAMVGQNYEHREGEATLSYSNGAVSAGQKRYLVVLVDNFEREELQRKEEAIEKARQIFQEAPSAVSQQELAEYFYDYLGKNITYETKIESREYLYSALCEKKTNCDGYTNAFALLCSMADIPCIEIISDTPKGEIGHTWNAICIEDQWVHVDCTVAGSDVNSDCENCRDERIYFGFQDELLVYKMLHGDIVPDCPEGLTPVLYLASGKVEGFTGKVKENLEENKRKCAVVLLDEGDLKDQINDQFVRELNIQLYYVNYETAEGKTVYYLFNND